MSPSLIFLVSACYFSCKLLTKSKWGGYNYKNVIGVDLKMSRISGFSITSLSELDAIKNNCKPTIENYALASAATAFVPIPGLDVAADLTMIYNMYSDLRSRYSLNSVNTADLEYYGILTPTIKKVFDYVTKEGIMSLVKSVAPKFLAKKQLQNGFLSLDKASQQWLAIIWRSSWEKVIPTIVMCYAKKF